MVAAVDSRTGFDSLGGMTVLRCMEVRLHKEAREALLTIDMNG